MSINQELFVYDAALRADDTLHEQMIERGGVAAPVRSMTTAAAPEEFLPDAVAAAAQETIFVLFHDLHRAARRLRPTATLNWAETFAFNQDQHKSIAATLIQTAKVLGDDTIFVVSPTVLTIVQCAGALQRDEQGDCSIAGHRVFIDPYADDRAPIIVARPGWFHFSDGSIHSEQMVIKNDIVISLVPDRIAIVDLVH